MPTLPPEAIAVAPLTLRPMTAADLPMLHDWLQRPHVRRWWDDDATRSLDHVRAKYLPRVLAEDRVTPYIALLADTPFGYAQSYVALGSGGGWWSDETDPGVRGIDQFIADESLLGRGLGTRLVTGLVQRLLHDPAVSAIQTDPDPANLRAIRCYEKAGFAALRTIVTPDGPALYMRRERTRG
jgi:AacA4 family aminoglycoside N(6')-acetyltransferase